MNMRRKSIVYGDRIFARVSRNGQTVFNYVTEKVSSMTELLSELRIAMKDLRGLVMIHIRNYNKGWGDERPLMLYPGDFKQRRAYQTATTPYSANLFGGQGERKMIFPWETH